MTTSLAGGNTEMIRMSCFSNMKIYKRFVVMNIKFTYPNLHSYKIWNIYRGYYTAARRYEFYFRVVKTIFYERAKQVSKILFFTKRK